MTAIIVGFSSKVAGPEKDLGGREVPSASPNEPVRRVLWKRMKDIQLGSALTSDQP